MVNEEKSTGISCKAVVGSDYCLALLSYLVIHRVYSNTVNSIFMTIITKNVSFIIGEYERSSLTIE